MSNEFDERFKALEKIYSLRNKLPLSSFKKSSKERVIWYCAICDDHYPSPINKKVYEQSGCPNCARKARQEITLSKEFPGLILEYDKKKNTKPLDYYSKHSERKVWWKCSKCGDEKYLPVKVRAGRQYKCMKCSRSQTMSERNALKIKNEGSLLERAPHIAKEWHPTKNQLSPADYTWKSGYRAHWICSYGHEWTGSISVRVRRNSQCKNCGNQNSQYEIRLYSELLLFDPDALWNQRHHGHEIDIFLPRLSIGIEVDGYPWHENEQSRKRDLLKNNQLKSKGISIVRYRQDKLSPLTKQEVVFVHEKEQFPYFCSLLDLLVQIAKDQAFKAEVESYLQDRTSFKNDEVFRELYLKSGKMVFRLSLADFSDALNREWSIRNHPLSPSDVYAHGKKLVWWKCPEGHSFQQSVVKCYGDQRVLTIKCTHCGRRFDKPQPHFFD